MTVPVAPVPRLEAGGTLAIVSPSGPLASLYPERLQRGITALKDLGYSVVEMPNARKMARYTAGTVNERASDMHEAFSDKGIDAIICSIGGRLSSQLLNHLDFDLIADNPKPFCGSSDATSLHAAFYAKCRFTTFYGPSVMANWAELPGPPGYLIHSFVNAVSGTNATGTLVMPDYEVTEYIDWSIDRVRSSSAVPAMRFIGDSEVEGPLFIGCLPVLCELVGTPWLPDLRGHLLLVEMPPAPYSPAQAASDLQHLLNAGVLNWVSGLLMGRPHLGLLAHDYSAVIREVAHGLHLPLLINVPVGHIHPTATLAQGVLASIGPAGLKLLGTGVM